MLEVTCTTTTTTTTTVRGVKQDVMYMHVLPPLVLCVECV